MTFIEDCTQEGGSKAHVLCFLVRYLNARAETCLKNSPEAHMLFKEQLCISIFYNSTLFFLLDHKSVVLC